MDALELPDSELQRVWIEAAGFVWVAGFFQAVPGDPRGFMLRALTVARAHYAAELALQRLREIAPDQTRPAADNIRIQLAQAADVHAFLVSAALFWTTLNEIVTRAQSDGLSAIAAPFASAAEEAKIARDHVEHLNERIMIGRKPRFGTKMSREEFREAVGAFDGRSVSFGNETFDAEAMLDAVRGASRAVGEWLRRATEPRVEVRIDPPGHQRSSD